MSVLIVRGICENDDEVRREIIKTATEELRRTYRPRENATPCGGTPSGVLVAVKDGTVAGTAEYIRREGYLYLQGVAVHPEHRGCGVCRALLGKAEEIAKAEKLSALVLCAIEETGNVEIFKRLGFYATKRAVAANHVNSLGGPVTQVDMERKIV